MLRLAVVLALCAVFGTLGACKRGGDDAPACGAIGAKFLTLARADLEAKQPDEARRRAVEDQLPAMRDSLVLACTETKWTAAVRRCLVNATDHHAFADCEKQLTEDQRRDLARSAAGEDITR